MPCDAYRSELSVPTVKDLSITGLVHIPSTLSQFHSIQVLHIESLSMEQNDDMARRFLLAFPLSFQARESSIVEIIGDIRWERLRVLHLEDVWASEQEIFNIFKNHHEILTHFTVNCASLKRGSWNALLLRLGTLKSSATIVLDGELCGPIILYSSKL